MGSLQPARESKTASTLNAFREHLREVLPGAPAHIEPADRLEDIIPRKIRRRVWRELQGAGFQLPRLHLSGRVFLLAIALMAGPAILMAFAFQKASILLSIAELWILGYRLSRPLAHHPPVGCETVRQAVLHLTRFTVADFKAGLWPHEDIADKVRLIVSRNLGIRFEEITEDTPPNWAVTDIDEPRHPESAAESEPA